MTQLYWPDELPMRPAGRQYGESGQDGRAIFEPDVGPSITRPRVTEQIIIQDVVFPPVKTALAETLRAFYGTTLKRGSLPFLWRDPVTRDIRKYKLMSLPRIGGAGSLHVQISMQVMRLPGAVPMAPYIPHDSARPPDWVADYDAGRYWISGVEVTASDLSVVSGDYLVLEQTGGFNKRFFTATYAGDVPQTAPTGVDWLAGFET